ncbi:hypothetical protein [Burkholderia cepacia]|uniref:hypothetical protein n=1 Tax=Burkholderia cepacia TaxID=292 RepID=UPI002AB720C4|nr:hypothetical protein [Burkholderia cepacia]
MHTIKDELKRLTKPGWSDIGAEVAVTIGFCVVAYFFDHARIAAFAIFPCVGLLSVARSAGINWTNTPWLKALILGACIALWISCAWWVLAHPRA